MDVNTEFILKGRGSNISCDFSESIFIPTETHDARLALKSFTTYNSIPNVEKNVNNQLKIKVPDGDWRIFSLETGAYELSNIYLQLVEWIELKYPKLNARKIKSDFKLLGNGATSKAEFLFFQDGYGIDFNVEHSLCNLLGFRKTDKCEGVARHIAPNIVNIANVSQFLIAVLLIVII